MWKFQANKMFSILFFGAPSFSNKPKLGLKVNLNSQNLDLSITITNTNTESSLFNKRCRQ